VASFSILPTDWQVRVVVRWAGPRISGRELLALRHVVPGFDELGLAEVRRCIGDADSWDLGVFPRDYAEHDLIRLAEAHALRLELIDV
jgi:hypothetical protein